MKAYTAIRHAYQVFVYLERIMELVHFICHPELWGEREKIKQELSKFHSELKQDHESKKYHVSMNSILMEFKADTTSDIQVGLCLLLGDTVIISSSTKRDCHINKQKILMSES